MGEAPPVDFDFLCDETLDDLMDIDDTEEFVFDTEEEEEEEEVPDVIPPHAVVINDPALHPEHLTLLLAKETDFGFKHNDQVCARLIEQLDDHHEAVAWILPSRTLHRFQPRTAIVAIIYFERIISKLDFRGHEYRAQMIRTTWVACLSLAAKMEENKKTLLSSYEVEDYKIDTGMVYRMELRVLSTLEWNMNQVTPFDFVEYFITMMKYDKKYPQEMKHDTIEDFLLYPPRVMILVHNKPSAIAAAATMMAYEPDLTQAEVDAKINSFPSLKFMSTGHVYTIYEILQGRFNRP